MKNLFLFLFAAFVFASCEKIIPLDTETTTPKLVINSMFSSDSVWKVHVSKSLSVLDQGELENIENANVRIEDANGNFVEELKHHSNGDYFGTSTPNTNSTYSVKVVANSYANVQGTSIAVSGIQIIDIDTVPSFIEGERALRFDVEMIDNGSQDNYYEISVDQLGYMEIFQDFNGNWDTVRSVDYNYEFYSTDPIFENASSKGNWMSTGIFRDVLFNGNSKTISLHLLDDRSSKPDYRVELEYVEVSIKNITQERFNYNKSYDIYTSASDSPFAQPVQVFSNIEGGFGIFAGYNDTKLRKDF